MRLSFLYVAIYLMVCHYAKNTSAFFEPVDPDAYRNVSELITCHGYTVEEHTVVTKDGYILSMQRIPGHKDPVLLIHGEAGDGKTWFLNPPGQSLGYILSDKGYDVWIINTRGTDYSQKHLNLSVKSNKFWDWSFDEIAKYDMPATIDYVLNATGKDSLRVIGYSRGNTLMFCLISEFPEYNKKVKLLVALEPYAYLGHSTTALKYLIPVKDVIVLAVDTFFHGEFLPIDKASRIRIAKFCKANNEVCQWILFAIGGVDRKNLNTLHESDKFRKYDYGSPGNFERYNRTTPPDYQLTNVKCPVAFFSSNNDAIADTKDVQMLQGQIVYGVFNLVTTEYNHFDFILAKDAQDRIYNHILQLLEIGGFSPMY